MCKTAGACVYEAPRWLFHSVFVLDVSPKFRIEFSTEGMGSFLIMYELITIKIKTNIYLVKIQ